MEDNDLDGRDASVRLRYKNRKDMVPQISRAEDQLAKYTDPWGPAFYSRFDDLEPIRIARYDTYVNNIVGYRKWLLPVTVVEQHNGAAAWFDQLEAGNMEIREVPQENGESVIYIAIKE